MAEDTSPAPQSSETQPPVLVMPRDEEKARKFLEDKATREAKEAAEARKKLEADKTYNLSQGGTGEPGQQVALKNPKPVQQTPAATGTQTGEQHTEGKEEEFSFKRMFQSIIDFFKEHMGGSIGGILGFAAGLIFGGNPVIGAIGGLAGAAIGEVSVGGIGKFRGDSMANNNSGPAQGNGANAPVQAQGQAVQQPDPGVSEILIKAGKEKKLKGAASDLKKGLEDLLTRREPQRIIGAGAPSMKVLTVDGVSSTATPESVYNNPSVRYSGGYGAYGGYGYGPIDGPTLPMPRMLDAPSGGVPQIIADRYKEGRFRALSPQEAANEILSNPTVQAAVGGNPDLSNALGRFVFRNHSAISGTFNQVAAREHAKGQFANLEITGGQPVTSTNAPTVSVATNTPAAPTVNRP